MTAKGKKKKAESKEKLFSVSELSRLTRLDRNTVQKRLGNVTPTAERTNLKLYRLKDALPPLIVGADKELDAAKLRKAQADARRAEVLAKREEGEVVDVAEALAYYARIFRGLRTRLYTKLPAEIAGALFKCQTRAEAAKVLQVAIGKIFNELRSDHPAFLEGDSGGDS
jgi:hypothetical protein